MATGKESVFFKKATHLSDPTHNSVNDPILMTMLEALSGVGWFKNHTNNFEGIVVESIKKN